MSFQYSDSAVKPTFEITENSIRIILPVMQTLADLTPDENKIIQLLKGKVLSSSAIVKETGFGKSKVVSIMNKMVGAGYVKIMGNGRRSLPGL